MSLSTDSAKKDLALIISGVLAAVLFFWLYSEYHPLGEADPGLGAEAASQISQEMLQSFGFQSVGVPRTKLSVNSSLLDSLQLQTDFKAFYKSDSNRRRYPVFYWLSEFKIDLSKPEFFVTETAETESIAIQLNEKGELLSLINSEKRLPANFFRSDVLSESLDIDHPSILPETVDSSIFERIHFAFSDPADDLNGSLEHGESTGLGNGVARKMAEFYINNSAWETVGLQFKHVEKMPLDIADAAKVTFSVHEAGNPQNMDLILVMLPTGTLISMEYNVQSADPGGVSYDSIKSGIRGAVLLLLVFWVLILFIIRFKMRLVDTKAAILVAVLAGFTFPFIILTELIYENYSTFGSFNFSFVSTVLVVTGVTAAFTSLIYFLITSIADSITRQNWVEKLQAIDLIRIGHFFNKPVGLSFIRGITYSFILAGVWALLFSILPERYISVDSSFYSDNRYLPNVAMVLTNLAVFFLTAQLIFLVFLGKVRSVVRSPYLLILITGFVFALMNPLGIDLGPVTAEFVLLGVMGLFLGGIYLRDDFFTVFITLFFLVSHLNGASGWLIDQSPDASLFYTNMILVFAGLAFGGYSLNKGKSEKELPNFVPEYIDELAQSERIKQELQIARKVQQSFLPIGTPDFEDLDIAAVCKPAHETGGDYYDFITLEDGRLAVVIGDVSGKGIQAAFYMTFIKGVIHAVCENFKSTVEVLIRANKLFKKNARKGTFISLIFGVVDARKDTFTFSRAGHNPLLFFDSREKKLQTFTPHGIGLGITDDKTFSKNISELSIQFNQNDILILFTDGVVEATNPLHDFYGDNRLKKLIETYHQADAENLLNKIVTDLHTFGDGAGQHDDMTIIVIKKK